jgi:lipid-binding SYLF domain-containing protein
MEMHLSQVGGAAISEKGMGNIFRTLAMALLCSGGVIGCASTTPKSELDVSVRAAESVLAGFQGDPAKELLRDKLKEAKAILIVSPGVDRGVVLARKEYDGKWSSPAFYRITKVEASGGASGGAGFTAGKQDIELIALAMTDKALDWFMSPQLPGKSSMSILRAGAGTSGGGRADVVLFLKPEADGRRVHIEGANIGGAFVSFDKAGNQSYYGRPATPAEILILQSLTNPDAAALQKAVAEAAQ